MQYSESNFIPRTNYHEGQGLGSQATPASLAKKAELEENIQEFVTRSQAGDGDAFGQLYDLFVDQIFRYVSFRSPPDEAEDLVELVFLKAWESIGDYRRGTAHFSAWLFRIAHNIVIDFYRVSQTRREAQTSLDETVPETRREFAASDRVHRRIERESINDALKRLPDDYRSILVLKYVNDFSYEEIEHILNRGYAALRILQFRALKALKKELIAMGFDGADTL